MRNHTVHFAMCGVVLAIGIVLAATGTAAALLPAMGCVLMMALMMWGMSAMHGRQH